MHRPSRAWTGLVAAGATMATLAACGPGAAVTAQPRAASSTAPRISSNILRPAASPIALKSAPRKLSVTYTYQGRQHTLEEFLTRTKTNGFVVLDGQKIVDERYVNANADTRFQSWSMAKSFTSAAIGIALHEGRIRSIDDPVTKYLPELRKSGYNGVSIRNLLRMSSGIAWDEQRDVPKLHTAAALGRPLVNVAARQVRGWKPGSKFNYTSMNSFVLARLIKRVTGMPYYSYVEKKIWKPAGMASTAYVANDTHGDNLGYCCYYATDRDYARFGLLYLRGGKAKGLQVVPLSWVKASTKPSASFNKQYGLHWWLGSASTSTSGRASGGQTDFMAAGFGGQYIYVSPKHGVVIVKSTASGTPGAGLMQAESVAAFRAVAAEVARTR